MAASRGMVKFATGLRSTRSEFVPGAERPVPPPHLETSARRRRSIRAHLNRATRNRGDRHCGKIGKRRRSFRLLQPHVGGTVFDVLMAKASAQSLANSITYLTNAGHAHSSSICTLRTTILAFSPAEVEDRPAHLRATHRPAAPHSRQCICPSRRRRGSSPDPAMPMQRSPVHRTVRRRTRDCADPRSRPWQLPVHAFLCDALRISPGARRRDAMYGRKSRSARRPAVCSCCRSAACRCVRSCSRLLVL